MTDEVCATSCPPERACLCDLTDGHDGPHRCVCGRVWRRLHMTFGGGTFNECAVIVAMGEPHR